ncbi:Histone-lysine N-methyltransferase EHMT2 [Porphyridium purpureum]|uniref:Histone-lysine N-methyltransferase EHMT2 n=1 Tax=Porphyridium purpureum TaxID=35688 RepID=A0A5J4Z9A4_PORPP|nr:Histone-lysine N-methyltransferase EHMT2 [Porphyridium purpureum]|eukprot:POR7995..scf295_1
MSADPAVAVLPAGNEAIDLSELDKFDDAAFDGDLDYVKAFVSTCEGPEQVRRLVNAQDGRRWTPLLLAVMEGHEEVARYLIEQGATVTHRDGKEWTALHWASANGHMSMIRMIVELHPELLNSASSTGLTPLMLASSEGFHDAARVLLELGADPSIKDVEGRSAEDMKDDAVLDSAASTSPAESCSHGSASHTSSATDAG